MAESDLPIDDQITFSQGPFDCHVMRIQFGLFATLSLKTGKTEEAIQLLTDMQGNLRDLFQYKAPDMHRSKKGSTPGINPHKDHVDLLVINEDETLNPSDFQKHVLKSMEGLNFKLVF